MKNYNICTPFPYLESEGILHDHIEEVKKKNMLIKCIKLRLG